MERELEVEVGVPLDVPVEGEGEVCSGALPGGCYVVATHVGHPDEGVEANRLFLEWAQARGLHWDVVDTPDGQRWGCRLELLLTGPDEEPDMKRWETQLAFRLAD